MNNLPKYAEYFMMAEFMKAQLEVTKKENGREGVDFIVKTNNGNTHELYLQALELDKQREIKINKLQLGEPKDNLWIALVLLMEDIEPVLYLIPTNQLAKADGYIFLDNKQGERLSHLSSWEIKVFTKAIPELSKFALNNIVDQL